MSFTSVCESSDYSGDFAFLSLRLSDVNFFILDLCAELMHKVKFFIIAKETISTRESFRTYPGQVC